ncbi:MAG: c-type cytochrome domain-containing protein [Bacteroidota bacterium]
MDRLERIVSNSIFFLLCLMTILLVFEDHVIIPIWMQPLGRMHPMILHFPIGFILLLVLANIFKNQLPEDSFNKVNKFLLLLTGLTTVLTALMGFFLSQEEGYTSDVLSIHKWIGVGVSYLMYVLILIEQKKKIYVPTLYVSFIGIVIAGHFGAGLTHGINFLTEPIIKNEDKQFNKDEPVLTSLVVPILESKCTNCHNTEKHKGELDLSTLEGIHKGGENGPIWTASNTDSSQIINRAMLPEEHKKHMPPKGKPQLTTTELALIQEWIKQGADEMVSLAQLSKGDSLQQLAELYLADKNKSVEHPYKFDFADPDLIADLNNPYRTVIQRAPHIPAIDVKIFGREAFKMEYLTELTKIKEQVVSLEMTYLPVGDETFSTISQFPNLEELNLSFTDVTGEDLSKLDQCTKLKSLSLSGTKVSEASLANFDHPNLEELFIWNTPITEEGSGVPASKNFKLVTGYQPDESEKLPLTEPMLYKGKKIISANDPVILVHKINGVDIRYTDDGSPPDSASQIFKDPLFYDHDVTIKAIAYKSGWLSSDTVTFNLIQRGEMPKSIELLYPTEGIFKGKGKLTLIDDEVGNTTDLPYFSWIGFYNTPFGVIADMGEEPPVLNTVAFNYGIDQRTRAAVPDKVELWAGNSKDDLKLIFEKSLVYDKEKFGNRTSHMHEFKVNGTKYRFYKIMAYPTKRLPEWVDKKRRGGAVFVDQIFFYKDRPTVKELGGKNLVVAKSNNIN